MTQQPFTLPSQLAEREDAITFTRALTEQTSSTGLMAWARIQQLAGQHHISHNDCLDILIGQHNAGKLTLYHPDLHRDTSPIVERVRTITTDTPAIRDQTEAWLNEIPLAHFSTAKALRAHCFNHLLLQDNGTPINWRTLSSRAHVLGFSDGALIGLIYDGVRDGQVILPASPVLYGFQTEKSHIPNLIQEGGIRLAPERNAPRRDIGRRLTS